MGHHGVSVAFPGASGIATGAHDQRLVVAYPSALRVFDTQTGAPLTQTISIPGSSIYAVSSSPNGQDAVVNTTEGWRLIDLAAQQPIGPWIPDLEPSLPVVGANDTVYTQGVTDDAEVWDLDGANLRNVACSLAGRNLTSEECSSTCRGRALVVPPAPSTHSPRFRGRCRTAEHGCAGHRPVIPNVSRRCYPRSPARWDGARLSAWRHNGEVSAALLVDRSVTFQDWPSYDPFPLRSRYCCRVRQSSQVRPGNGHRIFRSCSIRHNRGGSRAWSRLRLWVGTFNMLC